MEITIDGEVQNPFDWVFCGLIESVRCRYEVVEHPTRFTHSALVRVPYVAKGEELVPQPKAAQIVDWSAGKGGWTYMTRAAIRLTVADLRAVYVEARAEERAARRAEREAEATARALRREEREAAKAIREADKATRTLRKASS